MSHKKPKKHRHYGLIVFAVLLALLVVFLRGEHITLSVVLARLGEAAGDLLLERGLDV